jgi:hypothetical protein
LSESSLTKDDEVDGILQCVVTGKKILSHLANYNLAAERGNTLFTVRFQSVKRLLMTTSSHQSGTRSLLPPWPTLSREPKKHYWNLMGKTQIAHPTSVILKA